ncbi:hypothetical protein GCM10011586_05020 [Silvibacterium dinghuense]|nr:hypothetical protein GCM10011586_05020 [Silvibacterium dinghuense]
MSVTIISEVVSDVRSILPETRTLAPAALPAAGLLRGKLPRLIVAIAGMPSGMPVLRLRRTMYIGSETDSGMEIQQQGKLAGEFTGGWMPKNDVDRVEHPQGLP